jgi:Fur family ferric uptake transcriptional regulator
VTDQIPQKTFQTSSQEALKTLLNQEGFRLTQQRQKILAVLNAAPTGHHMSAEAIYQHLAAAGENIGISTVYRALHLMVNMGLIRELDLAEGRKSYEVSTPAAPHHHHLVCVQCGAVQEFEADSINHVGLQETHRRGFGWLDCQFTVYGLCPACGPEADAGADRG